MRIYRLAAFAIVWSITATFVIAQSPTPTPAPEPTAVLKGHTETIYAVAVSADGKQIATGSFDKTVKLWDEAGKLVRTLGEKEGHTNLVIAVAFSPDGSKLASGSTDNNVKLWETTTGKLVGTLSHPNRVDTVAFDKSGAKLATGCADGNLRIWDVSKPAPVAPKPIAAHIQAGTPVVPQPIYAVAWSPDAKQVATASFDKSVKIWDAEAGTLVRELKPGSDRPPLSADVRSAVPALVGTHAGQVMAAAPVAGHTEPVYTLAFSKNGQLLATGSSDRTVKLWKPATGELVRTLQNPTLKAGNDGTSPSSSGFVQTVRFSVDGNKLLMAGTAPKNAGYVAVWNVADGKLLTGFETANGPIYAADLRPDGSVVVGCGPKTRQINDSEAFVLPLGVK